MQVYIALEVLQVPTAYGNLTWKYGDEDDSVHSLLNYIYLDYISDYIHCTVQAIYII